MNNIQELVDNFIADYIGAVEVDGSQVANAWADARVQEITKDLNEEEQNHFVKLVTPKLQAIMQEAIKELEAAVEETEAE